MRIRKAIRKKGDNHEPEENFFSGGCVCFVPDFWSTSQSWVRELLLQEQRREVLPRHCEKVSHLRPLLLRHLYLLPMTCPSCGYPEPNRLGDWCPYCVALPRVRGDGSRPWADQENPLPYEQEEINRYNMRCQGTTKNGAKCRNYRVDGSWYCHLHGGRPVPRISFPKGCVVTSAHANAYGGQGSR